MVKKILISCLFLLPAMFALPQSSQGFRFDSSREVTELLEDSPHRLTIFLIPSKAKYDWSSPNGLYRSLVKNYLKNIFKKESYLLGHAFIELQTPLADSAIFTGMRVESRDEEKHYLFEEHYGLSILGADLKGRLEKSSELEEKVEKYSRKGQLDFITVLINKDAAARMLEFYREFRSSEDSLRAPSKHYGGAYYPRYYGEGAGCSAFAVAFLDVGGLLEDAFKEWKVELDIPLPLMGGPYNEGNVVTMKDVRKRHYWIDQDDVYEPFEIYDPTMMSEWIDQVSSRADLKDSLRAEPLELNRSRGILIDCREVPAPVNESIFIERETPSVFVK